MAESRAAAWRHLCVYPRVEVNLLVSGHHVRSSPRADALARTDLGFHVQADLTNWLSFFPETLRSLVGDGSIPPPLLNCTPAVLLRRKREMKEIRERGGEDVRVTRSHRAKVGCFVYMTLLIELTFVLVQVQALGLLPTCIRAGPPSDLRLVVSVLRPLVCSLVRTVNRHTRSTA